MATEAKDAAVAQADTKIRAVNLTLPPSNS
jgi:hypothetical protein